MNFIYYIMKDKINMTWIQQYWKTAEKHLLVTNTSPRYHTTHITTQLPKEDLHPTEIHHLQLQTLYVMYQMNKE
jgi:hypothetical protein